MSVQDNRNGKQGKKQNVVVTKKAAPVTVRLGKIKD
jgi:hypothetical protein